ncbi:unnamed protein product [Moneuplotes crassus]|uniref:Mitochondrial carrier protein n=1 Tax=Euplotes crassus TaxID=5936 RepID=A0AAD1XIA7_EUPCR|nr:unnamed protein product [Moneuplotes crassus]
MKVLHQSRFRMKEMAKFALTKLRNGGTGYKVCGATFGGIMLYTYTVGPTIQSELYRMGLAGIAATLFVELACQPIDTLNMKSKVSKNFEIAKFIQKKGVTSLMRGIQPVLYGMALSSFIYFILYKKLKDFTKVKMDKYNIDKTSLSSVFIMSAGASTLANLCAISIYYPYDLVKTRMQIKGKYNYKNVVDAFLKIRKEKTSQYRAQNFFRGLGFYSLTFIGFTTLEFSVYETIMMYLSKSNEDAKEPKVALPNEHHESLFEHKEDKKLAHIIVSSAIAGAIGGFFTNPLEFLTVHKQANPKMNFRKMLSKSSPYEIFFKGSLFRTSYYSCQAVMIFILLEKLGVHLDCEL